MSWTRTSFVLLALAACGGARAQNSTQGDPPEARKEGGIAGDPRGAIRALGGTSQNNFEMGGNKVDVPKLGGAAHAGATSGTPAGTTGPR